MIRDPLRPSRFPVSRLRVFRVKRARIARLALPLALGCLFCAGTHAQDQICTTVPARQEFWIRLTDPVSTYSSKQRSTVRAILIASPLCDGAPVFSTGTLVEGRITFIRRVGLGIRHGSSAVEITFDKFVAAGQSIDFEARVQEVANGRESVKRGVIEGIGGRQTPQDVMSTRLLHLPFWNPDDYWIFLLRRGAFPFSPEPEIYLPPGTDLRLGLIAPLRIPADLFPPRPVDASREDTEIDPSLREKLLQLPARSVTGSGHPSDVVNLAFLGSREQIETAFQAAGWTYSDSVSTRSVLREMRAFSSLASYSHLPISRQWLDGKAPDLRLQKSFDSYQKREHIRIWNEAALAPDLWAGSVIRETGATWSIRTGRFIHHVDGDLDAEREKLVRDLSIAGCVANVYPVQHSAGPQSQKNASGDELHSDGAIALIVLKSCEPLQIAVKTSATALPSRPNSRIKRLIRAQALSVHDLWRSNVIYVSVDLGLALVRSLRHRRGPEYPTRKDVALVGSALGEN